MNKNQIEQKIKDLEAEKVELTEVFMEKLGQAMAVFHRICRKENDTVTVSLKRCPTQWNDLQCARYFSAMNDAIAGKPLIDDEIHGLKIELIKLTQNN